VAAFHRLFEMFLRIIFNAKRLLIFGTGSIQGTAADVRGTAQETEFFNNDDACTVLQSRNCTGKSRSAATDNNNVGIVFDRRFICGRERFIEFVALCAGLFQTLFHSAEKRETGNSGAADFVEFGCLMIFDFGRKLFNRNFTDTRAL